MNIYLFVILFILIFDYVKGLIVDSLNLSNLSTEIPTEFKASYDAEKYKKSQEYLRDNTKFKFFSTGISVALTIVFILIKGFAWVDSIARQVSNSEIVSGLIFAFILLLLGQIISIPFSWYRTFVIEEKYGFNKTTPKTFITDIFKTLLLSVLFGAPIFSLIILFFAKTGTLAWLYCWAAVVAFELFVVFIAPVVILPLFNKFSPLEDGELKTNIETYAKEQNFALGGVFVMDGSKRSAKSNAFFTGFGKFRKIALFDTLIKNHSSDELVAVLAHEVGHFKKKHILKNIMLSILTTGLMFFLMSFFIENKSLFSAFGLKETSIYASLIFFAFLYNPVSEIISIISYNLSRKFEFEADEFAVKTFKKPEVFIDALKKLSVDNLSNLNPHPLKVFLQYSHPPVLKRIEAIRLINTNE